LGLVDPGAWKPGNDAVFFELLNCPYDVELEELDVTRPYPTALGRASAGAERNWGAGDGRSGRNPFKSPEIRPETS
jgi:hypothetical protein